MDEKDLKKALLEELETIAPKMSDKVAKAAICTSSGTDGGIETNKRRRAPRRFGAKGAALSALAAVLVIAIVLGAVLPPMLGGDPTDSGGGYLLITVNPQIELLYDENGIVYDVKSGNRDGDVMLSDPQFRKSLTGKSVGAAAQAVAEEAMALGYLCEDEEAVDAVKLTFVGAASETADSVSETLESYFVDSGVRCMVVLAEESEQFLRERYEGITGSLSDMLAAIAGAADEFLVRNTDNTDGGALTEDYGALAAQYIKDRIAMLGEEIEKTDEALTEFGVLNAMIGELSSDLRSATDIIFGGRLNYWDVLAYTETNPDQTLGSELAGAMEDAEKVLEKIAGYGCAVDSYMAYTAAEWAYGLLSDGYERYRDDITDFIDEAGSALSEIVGYVNGIYSSAAAWFEDIPAALEQFGTALEEVEMLASDAISTAEDYFESVAALVFAEREQLAAYAASFCSQRTPIDEQTYDAIRNELTDTYGTLENWYDTVFGNK